MSPFIVYTGTEKNIFNKEIIAERWTKHYNTYPDVADLVE